MNETNGLRIPQGEPFSSITEWEKRSTHKYLTKDCKILVSKQCKVLVMHAIAAGVDPTWLRDNFPAFPPDGQLAIPPRRLSREGWDSHTSEETEEVIRATWTMIRDNTFWFLDRHPIYRHRDIRAEHNRKITSVLMRVTDEGFREELRERCPDADIERAYITSPIFHADAEKKAAITATEVLIREADTRVVKKALLDQFNVALKKLLDLVARTTVGMAFIREVQEMVWKDIERSVVMVKGIETESMGKGPARRGSTNTKSRMNQIYFNAELHGLLEEVHAEQELDMEEGEGEPVSNRESSSMVGEDTSINLSVEGDGSYSGSETAST